jgi:hypothetical protein
MEGAYFYKCPPYKLKVMIRFFEFAGIFLTWVFHLGCNPVVNEKNDVKHISVNPHEIKEEVNLSEFAESIDFIKLQTDTNCVLGRINQMLIKNEYIYVSDIGQMILFVFDKKGRFVSKLDRRGKGPGEYKGFSGIYVNDDETIVEIATTDGKLLKFSNLEFSLLNSKPMEYISTMSSRKIDDLYYFSTQHLPNKVNNEWTNSSIIIAKDGAVVKTLFDRIIENGNNAYGSYGETLMQDENKELFFSNRFDNTFYRLDGLEAHPFCTVNFGSAGIDRSIGQKSFSEQQTYINNLPKGKAFFPELTLNTKNWLGFTYEYKQGKDLVNMRYYLMNKESDRVFHTKKIKNDLTEFPKFINLSTLSGGVRHEVLFNGYLMQVIQPVSLRYETNEDKKFVSGLGEVALLDNPIIMLMKLKK